MTRRARRAGLLLEDVCSHFPSLKGAPSTGYYFECERLLFEGFAPKLRDLVVLKTDLWNEAKNTEILRWVAEQGARPAGIDVSLDSTPGARASRSSPRGRCRASPGCTAGSLPSAGTDTSPSAWWSVQSDGRAAPPR